MQKKLLHFKEKNFLFAKIKGENDILHFTTPFDITIISDITSELKNEYRKYEEKGGLMWARPSSSHGRIKYIVEKITWVRNAIEDTPNDEGLNKSNCYRPDAIKFFEALDTIFKAGCFPLRFHTHPTEDVSEPYLIFHENFVNETSGGDRKSSETPYSFEEIQILTPRCLVVGNKSYSDELFIGFYDGGVAPKDFKSTKDLTRKEKIDEFGSAFSSLKLTPNQKIAAGIVFVGLILVGIRYRKAIVPVMLGTLAMGSTILTRQEKNETPKYYCMLSDGEVTIHFPKYENNKN
ncbi:MAG: hypothetical protein POELPBGB_02933 [Bacteroidia bacterium]|nr:hypothetical protein [Bacteroidia bacterium]